jgi:hypothetical protein
LLQTRHEKEIIRKNRIFREKQYEDRRIKDFVDALDREAVSNKSDSATVPSAKSRPFNVTLHAQ